MSESKPTGSEILAMASRRKRNAWIWRSLILLAVLAVAGVIVWQRLLSRGDTGPNYVTAEAKVGPLRETVTATGKLKGLDSVDVGAQISGRISRVLVDFNDHVQAGQVLAEIDSDQLRSRVEQSRAQVNAADASIRLAKATRDQNRASLGRSQDLAQKGLLSNKELEAAQADAARGDASVASAESQATLARASLKDAQTSLGYTTIKAPIDGVVLARLVEPGQTVAASLQSPVLFTLARDLSQLRLYVDVDEADVGKVFEAQDATFNVDAWPSRKFTSKVVSVHNLPTTGQTVVTYQAVLSVSNDQKILRPGMTATAVIVTANRDSVLMVPDAALRFTPPVPVRSRPTQSPLLPMTPPRNRGVVKREVSKADAVLTSEQGVVWVLADGAPRRTVVQIGGSDGQFTEVLPGPLAAGARVIVDQEQGNKP